MTPELTLSPPVTPLFATPTQLSHGLTAVGMGQACLAAPFEAMRSHYASAVMAGLVPRSLLACGQFERALDTLEKLCLGPLARRR